VNFIQYLRQLSHFIDHHEGFPFLLCKDGWVFQVLAIGSDLQQIDHKSIFKGVPDEVRFPGPPGAEQKKRLSFQQVREI
jgi:hypothetical protein